MKLKNKIGLGVMELCITPDRPNLADAQALLTDLVEHHGLQFIDTADSYSLGEEDFGYGEELTAHLMNRSDVIVATKGGFTRPGGTWKKCGDPAYIKSACEQSLRRLKVDSIPLYQFHQPDPEVPFEETLGAFIDLKNEGKIQQLGLSNVSLEQLAIAQQQTKISTVQNPLSMLWYNPENHDPILRFCEQHEITFLAFGPFGGFKNRGMLGQQEDIQAIAAKAGLSSYQFALAFLRTISPSIVPIPGSTNKDHILHNLQASTAIVSAEIIEELMAG